MGNGTVTNDGTINVRVTSELDLQSNSEAFVMAGGALNSTTGASSDGLVEIDNNTIILSRGTATGAPVE